MGPMVTIGLFGLVGIGLRLSSTSIATALLHVLLGAFWVLTLTNPQCHGTVDGTGVDPGGRRCAASSFLGIMRSG